MCRLLASYATCNMAVPLLAQGHWRHHIKRDQQPQSSGGDQQLRTSCWCMQMRPAAAALCLQPQKMPSWTHPTESLHHAQADPAQRITVQGIMQHPFFLKDLPQGSLERSSRLLSKADLLVASFSPQSEADIVSICARACRPASNPTLPAAHPGHGVAPQEQVRCCSCMEAWVHVNGAIRRCGAGSACPDWMDQLS